MTLAAISAPAARRPARGLSSSRTAPLFPADITDPNDAADIADPKDAAEATDSADAAEPTEPIDSTEPTEPIESREPFDPIERSESSEKRLRVDPSSTVRSLAKVGGSGVSRTTGSSAGRSGVTEPSCTCRLNSDTHQKCRRESTGGSSCAAPRASQRAWRWPSCLRAALRRRRARRPHDRSGAESSSKASRRASRVIVR